MFVSLLLVENVPLSDLYTVNDNNCWIWNGFQNGHGYGRVSVWRDGIRSQEIASRVFFELYKHPIPEGNFALHVCDTPLCVNPEHIFPGTQKENLADMRSKNRWARWSKWPYAQMEVGDFFEAVVPGTQWLYHKEWEKKLQIKLWARKIGTNVDNQNVYKVTRIE